MVDFVYAYRKMKARVGMARVVQFPQVIYPRFLRKIQQFRYETKEFDPETEDIS